MFEHFVSMAAGLEIPNPKEDFKTAQKISGYRVSALAFYQPGGAYLPRSAIENVIQDMGSIRVSGCCGSSIPADRVVITAGGKKYPILPGSHKAAQEIVTALGFSPAE